MRVVAFRLLQVAFAVFLLAVAFWPGIGLFYLAVAHAGAYPHAVIVGGAVWIMLLGLNLPLSRKQFQTLGAVCFLAMIGVVLFALHGRGVFAEGGTDELIITAIVAGGILLGWFTVSSHIWRSYRGVHGVDDADTGTVE